LTLVDAESRKAYCLFSGRKTASFAGEAAKYLATAAVRAL
jgi:hypothetical protein